MPVQVYIDGQEGTTGLKILERFDGRSDIALLKIDPEKRKDNAERKRLIHQSDITFLCLPDAAAVEAVALAEGSNTRIIDASTAHRTNPDWAYGFPELSPAHRERIRTSQRVAVPGCYASGFISLVYPLVQAGILPADYPVTAYALSGYSGGGKKAIAQYTDPNRDGCFDAPRLYALGQTHKPMPEMQKISGLAYPPMFNPIICDFFNGMIVCVPILTRLLPKAVTPEQVHAAFAAHYANQRFVHVTALQGSDVLPDGFMSANPLAGSNDLEVFVCGNQDRILLCARLDNLGKGASGAAVQCMNLMIGAPEDTGLTSVYEKE